MKALLKFFFGQYYHWYFVKFIYRDKKTNVVFHFTECIGLVNKKDVLDFRILKKASSIKERIKQLPETLLVNGKFDTEPITYLGKFKSPYKK